VSDDYKLQDESQRGERARLLLADELYNEAFDTLKQELMTAWQDSPARDASGRETLWLSVKLLGQLRQHIQSVMETGALANLDLSRRGVSAEG
jgi:hypothetical protein